MIRPVERLVQRTATLAGLLDAATPFPADEASLDDAMAASSDRALLDIAGAAGALIREAEVLLARAAGEISRRSGRDRDEPLDRRMGEKSPAALVAAVAGLDQRRASALVAVGEAVRPRSALLGDVLIPERAATAAALDAGELTVDVARLIVGTLEEVGRRMTPRALDELERTLVQQARELTVADMARVCRRVRDHVDPDGVEPREHELVAHVQVRRVQRADGFYDFLIRADPESAGYLNQAIEAGVARGRQPHFVDADGRAVDENGDPSEVTPDDDTRTSDRRVLDALVDLARASLRADDGDLSGIDTTLPVTVTEHGLRTGEGSAQILGVDEPISARTARRIACNARIIPVVLGGDSQPLDIGAGRRLFSKAQRQAMVIRDGGCLWPGCGAPPSRCQAAHVTPWSVDPNTDLGNGMLLCRFHHRRFDLDGWSLEHRAGRRYLIPPPWVDASRTPRRVGRPVFS